MIVAVGHFRFPRLMHFRNKIPQPQLAGLFPVHGPLIEHIQIGLPCFSVRVRTSCGINAGFAHQPPDEIRDRHMGGLTAPCLNLFQRCPALAVNLLFVPLGAALKAAVIRLTVIEFTPDLGVVRIGKAEGRMNQCADKIVIVMQVVDHGEQGKECLHFRQPVKVHDALIDSRDVHFPEMVDDFCGGAAGCPEQDHNVAVRVALESRHLFRRHNQ